MVRTKKVNKWAQSIQQARKELNVKGFVVGTEEYKNCVLKRGRVND